MRKRERERETDRQTDGQMDQQTDSQTQMVKQRDRQGQLETKRQTEFVFWLHKVPVTCKACLRNGSAQTLLLVTTLKLKLHIKFSFSSKQSILKLDHIPSTNPVSPGTNMVATLILSFKSMV